MPSFPSLSFGRRFGSDVVGLDIQPGFVAVVQGRSNGTVLVERAAAMPLPADTVREGDVVDADVLSENLRALFHGSGLSKRVRVGVANQRTVMRTLEVPALSDAKELAAAVRFQAPDQVPMPLANAVLDFQPLGVVETPAGPRQRVVLVAAQRDMVERLLTAVRGAGLVPVGVDMSAFALIRSLHRGVADGAERLLYLNVDGLTNVAIAEGTVCRFTRVLGGGIEEIVAELAERQGIPHEQARALLADVDLHGPPAAVPDAPVSGAIDAGEAGDSSEADAGSREITETLTPGAPATAEERDRPEPPVEHDAGEPPREPEMSAEAPLSPTEPFSEDGAHAVLENGVRAIASEVRNSLDFYRTQEGGGDVSRVVLSGSALELPGFAEALQTSLGVDVQGVTVGVADTGGLGGVSAHRLAVATGLSTAEVRR